MKKKVCGFTLLEVMFGLLIFAGIGATFFMVIRSASQESNFSGSYFSGILLSQKVAEDIIEEFNVNPFANETLMIKDIKTRNIVDGGSVFFLAFEDTRPPWGVIDSATDGGITQKHEPLYSQLKGFNLTTSIENGMVSGTKPDQNLQQVNLLTNWKNYQGSGKFFRQLVVFAPRTTKSYSDPLANIKFTSTQIDEKINTLLGGSPANEQLLMATINSMGSNKKILEGFSLAQTIGSSYLNSKYVKDLKKDCNDLLSEIGFAKDRLKEAELRSQLAARWYELAKSSFNAVSSIAKIMGKIADNPGAGATLRLINKPLYHQTLKDFKLIYRYFLDSMVTSRYHYHKLITPQMTDFAGSKSQQRVMLRILDMYRILAIAPGYSGGEDEYKNFIIRAKEMNSWRNQYLFRLFDQERSLAENKTQLIEKFPNLAVIDEILNQDVSRMIAFINKELNK